MPTESNLSLGKDGNMPKLFLQILWIYQAILGVTVTMGVHKYDFEAGLEKL